MSPPWGEEKDKRATPPPQKPPYQLKVGLIGIYIGGLGELVRLVRPPVTGRSASFRLRFRFVRAVRAGEAKLRGRM